MMKVLFTEDTAINNARKTEDGYMIASVRCARTGIQYYSGDELGRPDLKRVAVYRPEKEVFSVDSMESFADKPCTDDHPSVPVSSKTWKQVAVGSVLNEVVRDGEFIRVPIRLMDEATIDKVEEGKREVSMGYTMDLDWTDGVAPDGTHYQAVQRNLRMNHLAIVDKGRAGSKCRIGDGEHWATAPSPNPNPIPTKKPMSDPLKKVTVDGLSVTTTEDGAEAITKLTKDKDALQAQLDAKDAAHKTAIEAKDKELALKDAEIEKLKASQMDDKALDDRVKARAKLIGDAEKLVKDGAFEGKSDAEIRTAVVEAKHGKEMIDGKSDAYIEALYDAAVKDLGSGNGGDPNFRQAVQTVDHNADDDNGHEEYSQSLSDAWQADAA